MKLQAATKKLLSDKPLIFIVCNSKGGVRKSRLASFTYFCMLCMGFRPIVVALDANTAFRQLILGRDVTEAEGSSAAEKFYFSWDGNDEADALEYLHPILIKAQAMGQPVIIDLAAKGGKSGGVRTLTRTGLLRYATVIGLCPVTLDEKSAAGVIEALEDIKPDRWIKATFFGIRDKTPKYDTFATLDKLGPMAVAKMPELSADEAAAWGAELPVLPPELEDYLVKGGLAVGNWSIFGNYWEDCQRVLDEALSKAVPELNPHPVGTDSGSAKTAPSASKSQSNQ